MKISDEIRNDFLCNDDVGEVAYRQLLCIADRIDRKMVELPKDADGVTIRIGDVLYSRGNECRVVSITVKADEACVGVHTDEGVFLPSVNPKYLSRKNPEPLEPEQADSWEKLEKDARKTACDYAPAPRNEDGIIMCDGCPFLKIESCSIGMTIDLVERAKKLAGIEEGERPDSLERIAGDIESAKGWCDQNGDYGTESVSISKSKLIKWADRIRKLADKEGEHATN